MNIFNELKNQINDAVSNIFSVLLDQQQLSVELPKNPDHGDIATNAAMLLAKMLNKSPIDIAQKIKPELEKISYIKKVDVISPGFINFILDQDIWHQVLAEIINKGISFGANNIGQGELVNIEFVSTNPTGPMHIGHSRGAIYGDTLANLMIKCGYNITKEYYINDAGAQINVLADSVYLRYLEACGKNIGEIPAGLYPGEYLIPVGKALFEKYGDNLSDMNIVKDFSINAMMDLIRQDLEMLKVKHDVFFSERSLHEQNKISEVVQILKEKNLVYEGVLNPPKGKLTEDWEEREQLLFRTTEFGDDTDRSLQKPDGEWTYVAADIAYMQNKIDRGFKKITVVLGADHSGYKKRMQAIATALGEGKVEFNIKFTQLVNFFKDGTPFKMSKRRGTFITVEDVLEEVDKNIVRFVMLTRRNDQILDFDLEEVKEQSKDNPVFYVQYANARANSILKNAYEQNSEYSKRIEAGEYDLTKLTSKEDLKLIKFMASWPKIIEQACFHQEPHRLVFFLIDLAAEFHSFWNKGNEDHSLRFIQEQNFELSLARLILAKSVSIIIKSGLNILNISPIDQM